MPSKRKARQKKKFLFFDIGVKDALALPYKDFLEEIYSQLD